MVFIGIDPGKSGGLAAVYAEHDHPPIARPMPVLANGSIDGLAVYAWLNGLAHVYDLDEAPRVRAFVEKAQAMPKQGVRAVFNYGRGYGVVLGALEIAGIPFEERSSLTWKRHFSLVKKSKRASVEIAEKLFPTIRSAFYGPKGGIRDGMAEALLMAEYLRRKETRS